MPRLSVCQKIAALVLAATLTASWASAAPARPELPSFQQLWSLWSSLWRLLPASLDEGCHVDPSGGGCATGPSAAPAVTLDAGCHLDPDGRCLSGS